MAERFLNEAGTRRVVERLQSYIKDNTQVATAITSSGQLPPTSQAVYAHIATAIAGKIRTQRVSTLPTTGEANIIYLLIPAKGERHTMHMWIEGTRVDLGSLDVDLDGFWNDTNLNAITNSQIDTILSEVLGV